MEEDPRERPRRLVEVLRSNVKGIYLATRAFLPIILSGRDKTIVTVSSVGAIEATPGASGYETTEQLELRFNDFLKLEYGEEGPPPYAIHPGGIKTDLASGMPESIAFIMTDEPELPKDTVVWLTKERRQWLADRYLSCQWDMEELLGRKQEIEDNNLLRMRLRTVEIEVADVGHRISQLFMLIRWQALLHCDN